MNTTTNQETQKRKTRICDEMRAVMKRWIREQSRYGRISKSDIQLTEEFNKEYNQKFSYWTIRDVRQELGLKAFRKVYNQRTKQVVPGTQLEDWIKYVDSKFENIRTLSASRHTVLMEKLLELTEKVQLLQTIKVETSTHGE